MGTFPEFCKLLARACPGKISERFAPLVHVLSEHTRRSMRRRRYVCASSINEGWLLMFMR